jgi:uncharacterized caspase-like protein
MSGICRLILAGILAIWLPSGVSAQETSGLLGPKVALVIGNADYQSKSKRLANPGRDAVLMAKTLQALRFTVTLKLDLDRVSMRREVEAFAASVPVDATVVVYYAGHGARLGQNSYLIPVDARMLDEQRLPLEAYPLKSLLEQTGRSRSAVNILILDACRNNPFEQETSGRSARYRNWASQGFGTASAPRGTVLAYSTAPGELAADGEGANSLYTQILSQVLLERGLTLEQALKRVGERVRHQTRDDQIPWMESSLSGDFYLLPPPGIAVSPRAIRQATEQLTRDSGRGLRASNSSDARWYDQLSAQDWNQLDFDLAQRVRKFTEDEIPVLKRQSNAGSVVAMTVLGMAYREGVQRAKDHQDRIIRYQANNTEARRWLHKAADAGFPPAQAELGEMLMTNQGAENNPREARRLLKLAAGTGYPRARLSLADLEFRLDPSTQNMQRMFKALQEESARRMQMDKAD